MSLEPIDPPLAVVASIQRQTRDADGYACAEGLSTLRMDFIANLSRGKATVRGQRISPMPGWHVGAECAPASKTLPLWPRQA